MKQRAQQLLDVLKEQAGKDPMADRYSCGYIAAVSDITNITVEEITLDD